MKKKTGVMIQPRSLLLIVFNISYLLRWVVRADERRCVNVTGMYEESKIRAAVNLISEQLYIIR